MFYIIEYAISGTRSCHHIMCIIWLYVQSSLIRYIVFEASLSDIVISQFSSVQSLNHVRFFVTPWTVACQASLSIADIIMSVMPSDHLILCCPLLHPPSVFPIIRVFSNESFLCIRWPKYWSFSFSISLSSEYSRR